MDPLHMVARKPVQPISGDSILMLRRDPRLDDVWQAFTLAAQFDRIRQAVRLAANARYGHVMQWPSNAARHYLYFVDRSRAEYERGMLLRPHGIHRKTMLKFWDAIARDWGAEPPPRAWLAALRYGAPVAVRRLRPAAAMP